MHPAIKRTPIKIAPAMFAFALAALPLTASAQNFEYDNTVNPRANEAVTGANTITGNSSSVSARSNMEGNLQGTATATANANSGRASNLGNVTREQCVNLHSNRTRYSSTDYASLQTRCNNAGWSNAKGGEAMATMEPAAGGPSRAEMRNSGDTTGSNRAMGTANR